MNQTQTPDFIGRFPVSDTLGIGGMGVVYLATDPDIGRKVAIKVLQTSNDDSALERFKNEARTMGEISHPNIVMLLEYGIQQNKPFLVMEYLSGVSLQTWIQSPHKLKEHINIISDICNAIEFAHSKDILHRDLKPGNIQVLPDGQAKLLDFGIATSRNSGLTATGFFIGTPKYLAPEILQTTIHTKSSDCYSLGLLAYTMLSGRNPFASDSFETTMSRQLTVKPALLSELNSKIPVKLAKVIEKYLDKDPDSRPQTPQRLKQALNELSDSSLDKTIVPNPNAHQFRSHETTFVLSQNKSQTSQKLIIPVVILALAIFAGFIAYKNLYKSKESKDSSNQVTINQPNVNKSESTDNDPKSVNQAMTQNDSDINKTSSDDKLDNEIIPATHDKEIKEEVANKEVENNATPIKNDPKSIISERADTGKETTNIKDEAHNSAENIAQTTRNDDNAGSIGQKNSSDVTATNNKQLSDIKQEPEITEHNPVVINLPDLNHRAPKVRLKAMTNTQLSRGKTSSILLELSNQTEIDDFEIFRGSEKSEQIKIKDVEKISEKEIKIRFYVDPNTTLGSYTLKGRYGKNKTYPLYLEVTL